MLVTGGGPQSNHVRMTAAAANRLGLDCEVALAPATTGLDGRRRTRRRLRRRPMQPTSDGTPHSAAESGNLLLDHLLGARLHVLERGGYYDIEAGIDALAAQLTADGRSPFAIPVGGASVTGVTAYVAAADELTAQLGGERVDWVVVADGSGGTHAGLLAGLGDDVQILGVDVGTRPDLDEVVPRLAAAAADRTSRAAPPERALIDRERFGAATARSPSRRSRPS